MCISLGARVTFTDDNPVDIRNATGTVVDRDVFQAAFDEDVKPTMSEEDIEHFNFLTEFGELIIGADIFVELDNALADSDGTPIRVVQILPDMVTVDSGDVPTQ